MLETTVQTSPRPVPAGFWIRALARAVDWIVLTLLGFFTTIYLAFLSGMARAAGWSSASFMDSLSQRTWVLWAGSAIAGITYYAVCEGVCGATIGKLAIDVQVIGTDVTRCDFGQGLVRSAAFFVDALFFAAVGAMSMNDSPLKQRFGDRWAGTFVARRDTLPPAIQSSRLRIIATAVIGLVVAGIVTTATRILQYLWITRS